MREPEAEEYREVNDINTGMRITKDNWIEDRCQGIDSIMKNNNRKRTYQTVKNLKPVGQSKSSKILSKTRKPLTERKELLDKWTEYCKELYNHEVSSDLAVLICPHTMEEEYFPVRVTIKSLKKGKSAGADDISRTHSYRRRGHNQHPHNYLRPNLANRRMLQL